MCLAIPGELLDITGDDPLTRSGRVAFGGIVRTVALAFTPVVMSGGRISLKVKTEVSEIDPQSEVVLSDTRIPGI